MLVVARFFRWSTAKPLNLARQRLLEKWDNRPLVWWHNSERCYSSQHWIKPATLSEQYFHGRVLNLPACYWPTLRELYREHKLIYISFDLIALQFNLPGAYAQLNVNCDKCCLCCLVLHARVVFRSARRYQLPSCPNLTLFRLAQSCDRTPPILDILVQTSQP